MVLLLTEEYFTIGVNSFIAFEWSESLIVKIKNTVPFAHKLIFCHRFQNFLGEHAPTMPRTDGRNLLIATATNSLFGRHLIKILLKALLRQYTHYGWIIWQGKFQSMARCPAW